MTTTEKQLVIPTYNEDDCPSIIWEAPSWAGSSYGAAGYFEDYPDVRVWYAVSANTTRLHIANKVHPTPMKMAIKEAVSRLLPFTDTKSNYGTSTYPGAGIVFDVDPKETDLTEAFNVTYNAIAENSVNQINLGNGVKFTNTLSDGFGEREFMVGLIRSQQRGNSEFPGVGSKVRGEFQLSKVYSKEGRIDAVEFDEAGNVVTVIECQSGIKDGACLDNDHFARIISEYPYHPDLNGTVRKLVVIAGEYLPHHVAALQAAPFEVVILQTAIENDVVVLRPYSN